MSGLSDLASTLPMLLAAREREGAVMLIDRDRPISAAELALESKRMAQGLYDLGVRAGDRVAVWLPNVPAWFVCLFACAQLGAIVVPVNTRFRSKEIADVVGCSQAKILIFWPGFRGIDFKRILNVAGQEALAQLTDLVLYGEADDEVIPDMATGRRFVSYGALLSKPPKTECVARPGSAVLIFTTSGTTHLPKLVLHSQASIVTHAREVARAFHFDAPDARVLLTLPLCGTFGLCNALGAIAGGQSLLLLPSFDAKAAAAMITRHRVTHFPAAGDIVAQLLAIAQEEKPFPSVRLVIGARPGQAAVAERRGLKLIGVYGSSEIQAMISRQDVESSPEERERGGGKMISAEAFVRARDTVTRDILPDGKTGELEFFVPSRMLRYLGNEKATNEAFTADGYFRSGDLGYTVSDKEFVFESRIGDALRLSGFLVNPMEIEHTLDAHPAVSSSQVVGVEGHRGQRAIGFVILKAGATFDESLLISHCREQIAGYKVPERIFVVDHFPITPSANGSKIQKGKLREIASGLLAGDGNGNRTIPDGFGEISSGAGIDPETH